MSNRKFKRNVAAGLTLCSQLRLLSLQILINVFSLIIYSKLLIYNVVARRIYDMSPSIGKLLNDALLKFSGLLLEEVGYCSFEAGEVAEALSAKKGFM